MFFVHSCKYPHKEPQYRLKSWSCRDGFGEAVLTPKDGPLPSGYLTNSFGGVNINPTLYQQGFDVQELDGSLVSKEVTSQVTIEFPLLL